MSLQKIPIKKERLTNDQKVFISKMSAAMMSTQEIINEFYKKYGIALKYSLVYQHKNSNKWNSLIKKERERYLTEMADVPIFHPRIRFNRYENMYNLALEQGDLKGMHDALSLTQAEFGKKVGGDTYNQVFMTNNTVTMSMEEIRARKDKLLGRLHELNPGGSSGPDRQTEEN